MDEEGRVVEAGVEGELVTRYVEGKGRSSGLQPPGLKMNIGIKKITPQGLLDDAGLLGRPHQDCRGDRPG